MPQVLLQRKVGLVHLRVAHVGIEKCDRGFGALVVVQGPDKSGWDFEVTKRLPPQLSRAGKMGPQFSCPVELARRI